MIPLSLITEDEVKSGQPQFLIGSLVLWKVEDRQGNAVVCFGKSSCSLAFLSGLAVITAALVAVAIFSDSELLVSLAYIFLAGLVAGVVAFLFYSTQQQEYLGIELEIEPRQCVVRRNNSIHVLEKIDAVVLVNSPRFRNGDLASEGAPGELFLRIEADGKHRFVPLALAGNDGQCGFLAKAIAKPLQVKIIQLHRS